MARHVLKGPREMFTLRRVFAFLAVAGFVLGGVSHAHAQSVTLSTQLAHSRPSRGNLMNSQINYADCAADDEITFSVALAAYGSNHIEAWAGQGCDDRNTRISTTVLNCWKVASVVPTSNTPDPLKIPVKTILYGRTTISGNTSSAIDLTGTAGATAGTGGADSTAGASATAGADSTAGSGGTAGTAGAGTAGAAAASTAPPDACTDKVTETGPQSIIVFFMLVDGSNNSVGTIAQWVGTFKLQAPAPPDNVSVGIGENLLPVNFSYASTNSDMSINGYNFYCDPPPGTDAAADAGVLPVDGGEEPSCGQSNVLKAGGKASDLSAYLCGNAGRTSTRGNATGLVDGVAYNVAVATTDSFSNTGVLSKVVCKIPQPVTGFFEAYTDAGGKGGGGFCSFSRHRETFTLFALLGCASCLFLRRRRAA